MGERGSQSGRRVAVIGASGRMGAATVQAVQAEPTLELVARVGSNDDLGAVLESCQADVAIDFTTPERVASHLRLLIERRIHPIIGTTGLTPAELEESVRASAEAGLGGLVAPNFSIGAVLMMEFAERAARFLPEAEVTGPPRGKLLVVGWGGTHGAITEACENAREAGLPVSNLHLPDVEAPLESRGFGTRDVDPDDVRLGRDGPSDDEAELLRTALPSSGLHTGRSSQTHRPRANSAHRPGS